MHPTVPSHTNHDLIPTVNPQKDFPHHHYHVVRILAVVLALFSLGVVTGLGGYMLGSSGSSVEEKQVVTDLSPTPTGIDGEPVDVRLLLTPKAPEPTIIPTSGIKGKVLIGPTCPVMQNPQSHDCEDKPYVTTLTVTRLLTKQVIAKIKTESDGTFSLFLPEGDYLISGTPSTFSTSPSQSIYVKKGTFTNIVIMYDSGIR